MSQEISQRSYQPLTFRHGTITGARFDSDGKTVYYSAAFGADPSRVFRTHIDSVESELLKHVPPGAFILSVSRKVELAVLLTNLRNQSTSPGTLALVPALGGTPRPLTEDMLDADWLPDGERLAVLHADRRFEFPQGHKIADNARMPRVSPNGELVAFIASGADGATAIEIWNLQGQPRLSYTVVFAWGLAWSPDSSEIWYSGSDTLSGYDRAIYALSLSSGKRRLVARVPGPITIQDIAPDGGALVMSGAGWTSLTILRAGDTQEQTLDLLGRTDFVSLSDDGKWILAHERREVGEGNYVLSTDGQETKKLTNDRPLGLSPDGKFALVQRQDQLLLLPTGAGPSRPLPTAPALQPNRTPAAHWSRDTGRLFVLFREVNDGNRIYMLDGEKWLPVTPGHQRSIDFAVSPDGRWVATAAASGTMTLFPIDGSKEKPLTGAEGRPLYWSWDGAWLYMQSPGAFPTRIYRYEIATGRHQPWREITPADPAGLFLIDSVRIAKDGEICAYLGTRASNELFYARGLK